MVLPSSLAKRSRAVHLYLTGENAMHYQKCLRNCLRSDMVIESTVMRYVYGPDGMAGLTFNEKALDHWAKSLHKSTIMENEPA